MDRRTFLRTTTGLAAASGLPGLSGPAAGAGESGASEPVPGSIHRFGDGRDWFFEKRFGLFVHWGLYAIPAWHEQHQWRARVPRDEYVRLRERWNPTAY